MKDNEISERKKGDLLYEAVEPLFPEDFPRRRRMLPKVAALFVIIAVAVCIWAITVYGIGGDGNGDISGGGITETESAEEPMSEGASEAYETVSDRESVSFETDTPTETEGESASGESESAAEERTEGVLPDIRDVIEVDLSLIEKGEKYVVNYSDKVADVSGLIDRGFVYTEEAGSPAPLVLVLHTHTSEEYMSGGSGYKGLTSVVSVGDVLVTRLNTLGVGAVHCTVIHDGDGQNAYMNAASTIDMMLKIYPSIRYVIDLHRLELESGGVPIKTVSGCSDGSAQIRLSVGTQDAGDGWQEDLSLTLSLRRALNAGGRVCMPVVISPSIPNSEKGEYYIMVDVGTSGNTVEEAMAAGERLAIAIADVVLE